MPEPAPLSGEARSSLILAAAAHELLAAGDIERAHSLARMALATADPQPNCHSVMAGIQEALGQWDPALAHWRDAVRLAPQSPGQRHNLAIALMTRDRWVEAADHYDARIDKADWTSLAAKGSLDGIRFRLARLGDALAGRPVVVFSEQGLGDCVWASRWLRPLTGLGADVTVAVRPALAPLIALIAPELPRLVPPSDQADAKINLAALAGRFDRMIPFMSLPFLFGVTAPTADPGVPYLAPDPARVAAWRARYAEALPGRRPIGVVWRANPANGSASRRSIAAEAFAPLACADDTGFVNLQGGPTEGRQAMHAVLPAMFDALAEGEPPLDELAAAIAATDGLVTVDTMAAHLAGAMGHRAWVLVPAEPHFYWGLGRSECPWYPGSRLFRQTRRDNWADAIASVRAALQGRV